MALFTFKTLLVEDNPADAEFLNRMLDSMLWAAFPLRRDRTLRDAIVSLKDQSFDLILVSLSLPDSHGLHTLAAIRAASGQTPIIALSGSGDSERLQNAGYLDARVLVKGEFDRDGLSHVVRMTLLDSRANLEKGPANASADAPVAWRTPEGGLANAAKLPERAGQRPLENEGALMAAVSTTHDLVTILDQDGLVRYVNPAFSKATGFYAREILGKSAGMLSAEEQGGDLFAGVVEALAGDDVWSGQISSRRKNGELLRLDTTVSVVRGEGGTIEHYVMVSREMTDLVELQCRLDQSTRLNTIGKLAGGIAHEFNNTLQAIISYAALLADQTKADLPHLNRYALGVGEAAKRAANLTRQLLIFGRKQNLQVEMLDLNDRIAAAVRLVERLLGEDFSVTLELEPTLPPILADATLVEQIVMNLCVNARDAMREGGEVRIASSRATLDRAFCDARAWATEGDYLHLSVSDSRPGIPPEQLAHVVEPAHTRNVGDGFAGMEPASLHGAVKQLNGLIHSDSDLAGGTTVHVYFPIALEETPETDGPTEPENSTPEIGLRILVAEDDPLIAALTSTLLEGAGYKVTVVRDGQAAFQELLATSEAYSLVLSDVVMPKIGGIELMSRTMASSNLPSKPLFLLNTGYGADAIAEKVPEGIPYGYLRKPFSPAELIRTVRRMLQTEGVSTLDLRGNPPPNAAPGSSRRP